MGTSIHGQTIIVLEYVDTLLSLKYRVELQYNVHNLSFVSTVKCYPAESRKVFICLMW